MNRLGLRGITLCAALLLLVAATPFDPRAELNVDNAPDSAELEMLEELATWIDANAMAHEPQTPWGQRIRERPTSFEVFHSYHGAESRYEPLDHLPFGPEIRSAAENHGVDGLLVAAIVEVESQFNPRAVSHRGARGLMQVMPTTFGPAQQGRLYEPDFNLDVGAAYLRRLLDRFHGDLELTLAAYNAGPTNVRRYGGVPPFRETRRYVEKVLAIYVDLHREVWLASESGERLALLDESFTEANS